MPGRFERAGSTTRVTGATTAGETGAFPVEPFSGPRAADSARALSRIARPATLVICLITAIAAALRLAEIDDVGANQFYDAAVRSMSLSWHNFFFGAFDPGAILAVDKPPIDLWLQVASTRLFGWNAVAIRLPEVIGGTLAVPLLYDALRRVAGRPAALGAALALAVLPVSVVTSRSDTMDSLMMLFVVAALWWTIRAAKSGSRGQVVLAGVMLGLAFNVKLFEALLPAPALLAYYVLASPLPRLRRLADAALAAAALVAVGLSWAAMVSLAPGSHPFPTGSSDGTVWNVIFVFNGLGRAGDLVATGAGAPGLLRLFRSSWWEFDVFIGCVVVPALALGAAAVGAAVSARLRGPSAIWRAPDRALAVMIALWVAIGLGVFSSMGTLHARYIEALTPGLAAGIGCSAAALVGVYGVDRAPRGAPRIWWLAPALAAVCAYAFAIEPVAVGAATVGVSLAALGTAWLARNPLRSWRGVPPMPAASLSVALVLAAVLLVPARESVKLVRQNTNDSHGLTSISAKDTRTLSRYLGPRTVGLRYELAVDEPISLAPLIIRDGRPILPLTSFKGILAVRLPQLRAAIQAGQVRYALVGNYACTAEHRAWASCGPAALWIRRHGINVSAQAGLASTSRLYLLPGV
jgi:4-amino-4-deoxy-L-arabinose transferase-like glycosyltransferase